MEEKDLDPLLYELEKVAYATEGYEDTLSMEKAWEPHKLPFADQLFVREIGLEKYVGEMFEAVSYRNNERIIQGNRYLLTSVSDDLNTCEMLWSEGEQTITISTFNLLKCMSQVDNK